MSQYSLDPGSNIILDNTTVENIKLGAIADNLTWDGNKLEFTFDILAGSDIKNIELDNSLDLSYSHFIINIKSGAKVIIANSARPNNSTGIITYNIENGANVTYL
jgi:hypothetical protein